MKSTTIISKLSQAFSLTVLLSLSAPVFAAMDEAAIEPYLKKQGCMKCHAIAKEKKGPSYKKIAAKYKGKAEGESKAIKNMVDGQKVKLDDGTEEEHKVIETKDQGDLKAIAQWILAR